MSYWDSSALVKLYLQELDSAEFCALAVEASRVVTGSLTRHEVRTVFRRREVTPPQNFVFHEPKLANLG